MRVEQTTDLKICHALRREVFVKEQGVPEAEEMDDLDAKAIHLLGMEGGRPVATARVFINGESGKIGRVCVLRAARGTGAGGAVMRGAIDLLRECGVRRINLSSQMQVLSFYEKLGFVAYGPEYSDAGILHRDMMLEL